MEKVFGLRVSVPNRFREPDIIYEVSKLYVVNCLYAMISKSWRKNKKKKKKIIRRKARCLSIWKWKDLITNRGH